VGHPLRVTVWNEWRHERRDPRVAALYPDGIHAEIAGALRERSAEPVEIRCATLDEPGQGLPHGALEETDVLVWWGHAAHDEVSDETVERVHDHVLRGMGFVSLHASALSRPTLRLLGTSCTFRWREADDRELLWTVAPSHPIARGVPAVVVLPQHEMYGEPFDVPEPDTVVFISAFSGGEVFRSGCCYQRGAGRVFLFSPGHETFPVYRQPEIRLILANATRWAAGERQPRVPSPSLVQSPPGWFAPEPGRVPPA
jgi:trehalose utilization protein